MVTFLSSDAKRDSGLWCGLFTRGSVRDWNQDCGAAVQLRRYTGKWYRIFDVIPESDSKSCHDEAS